MRKPIRRLGISSLTEQYSQRLNQLNEIDQFKARVGWRVSIAASVVSTLAYLIGIFFTSISVTEHLFQVGIRMLLIATVYFQFIQPKIDFWRSSLLFFLIVLIFSDVYHRGSISLAPGTLALPLIPIIGTMMLSKRQAHIVLAMVIGSFVLLYFMGSHQWTLPPSISQEEAFLHQMMQGAIFAIGAFYVGKFSIKGREIHQKIREESVKRKKIEELIITYNHEINNPLSILTGYLRILDKKQSFDPKTFKRVQLAADRIAQVVKNLNLIANGSVELVETQYSDRSTMIQVTDAEPSEVRDRAVGE